MSNRMGFWLERFDVHLGSERRLDRLTRQHYRRDLATLADYCSDLGLVSWEQVTSDHIRSSIALRHRAGLAGRSLQAHALQNPRALSLSDPRRGER